MYFVQLIVLEAIEKRDVASRDWLFPHGAPQTAFKYKLNMGFRSNC